MVVAFSTLYGRLTCYLAEPVGTATSKDFSISPRRGVQRLRKFDGCIR
jgi:hypothetical protein